MSGAIHGLREEEAQLEEEQGGHSLDEMNLSSGNSPWAAGYSDLKLRRQGNTEGCA